MKKKIKKHEAFLQKLIKGQALVKFELSLCGEEERIFGIILAMSEHFLLVQVVSEFSFDGYSIITKYDYNTVRCNKYDKANKKILVAEGFFESNYGINTPINLESWATILNDLQQQDFHVIARNIRKDYLEFNIGPIVKVTNKKVKIKNYDATGTFDDQPTSIKFDDLRIITFGDKYSSIFRKYLK